MTTDAAAGCGSSASTTAADRPEARWRPRRRTASAIALTAVAIPAAAAVVVANAVGGALPRPDGPLTIIGWWGGVIVSSSAVLLIVDRLARRLLPLAALYRMSLAFPDKAPSRFKVAMLRGNSRQLARRVQNGELGATPSEAAENLLALVGALGRHDRRSLGHSERVRAYADLIGTELRLPIADREKLSWSALVHDVGKIQVRPSLLTKSGRPTPAEWKELRSHPVDAEVLVAPLRPWLGEWLDAATQHHERIDGGGYPAGLRGEEITLAARIVSVADAYDTMTSARSYKRPWPAAQARLELTKCSGSQFDPAVVRAFLQVSVGRSHLAAGPIAWLTQFPVFLRLLTLSSGGAGPALSAAMAGGAVVAATGMSGLSLPIVPSGDPEALSTPAISTLAGPESTSQDTTTTTVPDGDTSERGRPDAPGPPAEAGPPQRPDQGGRPADPGQPATPPGHQESPNRPSSPPTTPHELPAQNQPPEAVDDAYDAAAQSNGFIDVLANDSDDAGLDRGSLTIIASPTAGTATVAGGRIRYTAPDTATTTQLTYEVCDDDGGCDTATVTITITSD